MDIIINNISSIKVHRNSNSKIIITIIIMIIMIIVIVIIVRVISKQMAYKVFK